mmetsp:Transcript_19324/g.30954  ORF Transcript_19324/g.30954 Transcript_19324/m.30954 type:complete len:374 (+) Transcript_19324:126-1247(+)
MPKDKRTRKFAQVKRMMKPSDERLKQNQEKKEKKEKKEPAEGERRSGRSRKQVEYFAPPEPSTKEEDEFVVPKGKGMAISDMEKISHFLNKFPVSSEEIQALHKAFYGRKGKRDAKKNVLAFSGLVYPEGKAEAGRDKVFNTIGVWKIDFLREMMDNFGVDRGQKTKKEELLDTFIDWLEKPTYDPEMAVPGKAKKAPKKKAAPKKKKAAPKKKAAAGTKRKKSEATQGDKEGAEKKDGEEKPKKKAKKETTEGDKPKKAAAKKPAADKKEKSPKKPAAEKKEAAAKKPAAEKKEKAPKKPAADKKEGAAEKKSKKKPSDELVKKIKDRLKSIFEEGDREKLTVAAVKKTIKKDIPESSDHTALIGELMKELL